MVVISHDDVCLLILKNEMSIIPVSISAFRVTQSSKKKLRGYCGSLVVSRDGSARVIKKIEVLGFWGEKAMRKLISFLTGAYELATHFEPVSLSLDEFKSLLIEYLDIDNNKVDPYLPQEFPLDVVFDRVRGAQSFDEAFDSINLPSLEDSLDVL